jgi:hypothetical protein
MLDNNMYTRSMHIVNRRNGDEMKIALGARVEPPLKKALERAAREETRSLSGLVEKILADWIKARREERK